MNQKCIKCKVVDYPSAVSCVRCSTLLAESVDDESESFFVKHRIAKRSLVCLLVLVATIAGFYASLIFSAASLSVDQRKTVAGAISILEAKGFADEVFLLQRVAVYRSNDHWFNASVEKENAFAATNFPFEIVTLYPDYFTFTADDTERAAILLHEAKHLQGFEEKEAYEFVWKNRIRFGWTAEKYKASVVWQEIRKQTRDYSPSLFICEANSFGDCTE